MPISNGQTASSTLHIANVAVSQVEQIEGQLMWKHFPALKRPNIELALLLLACFLPSYPPMDICNS